MSLSAGMRLGCFDILESIGAGGMGEVYRARDSKLGRDVAIKILPSQFTADPERRARFAREAQTLATLNHPNIGAIYGLEEADAVTALVLELVEGQTLADRLKHGPLPRSEALAIAQQIADALVAAHGKGIVHRDLKPANIVLQGTSALSPGALRVKVLDFGLAKPVALGLDGEVTKSPLGSIVGTDDGRILGTPAYMSPEQARGLAVDKRTDIWAFGCVVFEMLTGRKAFSGDTVADTLAAVLRADLEWKWLPPDTPVFARRLLRRCLDKDPKRRLQHIGDARLELDQSAFERLVTDISARFVNAQPAQVDAEITGALRSLVEFLAVDRSTLFQWSADGRNLQNTHHWVVEGCQPVPPVVVHDVFPYFFGKVLEGKPYSYANLDELPPEAAVDRVFIEKHGPKSNLTLPLVAGGSVVGALAFGVLRHECQWPDVLTERLSVVAHVFANALERKRSDLALQHAYTEVTQLKERLELDNQYLRQELAIGAENDAIVAQSAVMKHVLSEVRRVAATDSPVLLYGETGTGKELLAEAVHQSSKRKDRLLVRVNCAALPASLIESELFGREKGAYTGALSRESGRFGVADGGTLFLDEVIELPLKSQAKLLRVLESGTFERLDSSRTVTVNVRLIAASTRDLGQPVREHRFREDLFFRLQVFPIQIPPLRERREDIPPLVWAFIKDFGRQLGKVVENVPRHSMNALHNYSWPGNVRELRNVIERSMILTDGPTLRVVLPDGFEGRPVIEAALTLEEVERRHILDVLAQTGWRISGSKGAARILNVKPTTLEYLMKKLGIERNHVAPKA